MLRLVDVQTSNYVQTVKDLQDQNYHRICFATLGAGLSIITIIFLPADDNSIWIHFFSSE